MDEKIKNMIKKSMLIPIIVVGVLVIAAIFFLVTWRTEDNPPNFKINVNLETMVVGSEVEAILTFANLGPETAAIEKRHIFTDGKIDNNVFEITSEGKKIPYTGISEKNKPSGHNDYVNVLPGKSLTSTVKLNGAYDFLPGIHNYEIKYLAYNTLSVFGMPLESNKDAFSLYKGYSFVAVKYGQSAETTEGINIEFLDMVEESRCQIGYDCVVDGNASIKINAFLEGTPKPSTPQILTILGGYTGGREIQKYKFPSKGNVINLGKRSLVLARLTPYPTKEEIGMADERLYSAEFFMLPIEDIVLTK